MPVNKEAIKYWIEALRSGKYTQAISYLRSVDGYCCLGVAANIYGVHWVESHSKTCYSYNDNAYLLDGKVSDWLGIGTKDVVLMHDILHRDIDEFVTLTASKANDMGFTFSQIADMLEYRYLSNNTQTEENQNVS